MNLEKYRKDMLVYVDTSVVSGMFDHTEQTKPFWDAVLDKKIKIIVSDILTQEVGAAPEQIQTFFRNLPEAQIQRVVSNIESSNLAAGYIDAGVISKLHLTDCMHIALATINHADYLVSWNFKDIVNANKIHGYNAVNFTRGYPLVQIITPYILFNGDEDDDDDKT